MTKKPVTKAQMKIISDNIGEASFEDIAAKTKLSVNAVKKAAKEMGFIAKSADGEFVKSSDYLRAERELKATPTFKILQREFTDEEVAFFVHQYCIYISQFDSDVMASEKTQIAQAVKLELLMQRELATTKRVQEEMLEQQERLMDLYRRIRDARIKQENTDAMAQQAAQTEEILQSQRSGQSTRQKNLLEIQTKHAALMKDLKATREQRISKIESASKNFVGLIKALEEEEFRKREGRELELIKLATKKEKERLTQPTDYNKIEIDQPILNAETVI